MPPHFADKPSRARRVPGKQAKACGACSFTRIWAVPALGQLLVGQLENLRYTWFLPLLLLGEFLLVVALYFAAKGRLYKLNLMEMLSQER